MARSKTWQAIGPKRRRRSSRKALARFIRRADKAGDLDEWRRGKAVLGYIEGTRVIELAEHLGVTRGAVNRWLGWYDALGIAGLRTVKPAGAPPKLSTAQQAELGELIELGPIAAGYGSGVWTGPMIGDLIAARFGVRYHNHTVPRLLHHLGFSVQRPRKRLAKANKAAQAYWLRKRLPAIKKKPPPVAAS